MVKYIAAAVILSSYTSVAGAQAIPPGKWDVTSTVVDISVPGVPGFLVA